MIGFFPENSERNRMKRSSSHLNLRGCLPGGTAISDYWRLRSALLPTLAGKGQRGRISAVLCPNKRFDYLSGLGAANSKRCRMKRLIIFDVLRGIFLLMMIIDHSPSRLRLFTDQPFGFFP